MLLAFRVLTAPIVSLAMEGTCGPLGTSCQLISSLSEKSGMMQMKMNVHADADVNSPAVEMTNSTSTANVGAVIAPDPEEGGTWDLKKTKADTQGTWTLAMVHNDLEQLFPNVLAIFAEKSKANGTHGNWFVNSLRSRGATILHVPEPQYRGLGSAGARSAFWRQCWRTCPKCSWVFLDTPYIPYMVEGALSVAHPGKRLIVGVSSKTIFCPDKYHRLLSLPSARLADVLLVNTAKYMYTCPEVLRKKMLLMTPYLVGTPSLETLAHREKLMQQEMKQRSANWIKTPFIFAGGMSGRDFDFLLRALSGLRNIHLRIYSGGRPVKGCRAQARCRIIGMVPREEYQRGMEEALAIALPLLPNAKAGAGVTTLYEAVQRGKIVIMTDRRDSVADGILWHARNGFLLGLGDVVGWADTIRHLSANFSFLHMHEQLAFDVARQRLSREAVIDAFACLTKGVFSDSSGGYSYSPGLGCRGTGIAWSS